MMGEAYLPKGYLKEKPIHLIVDRLSYCGNLINFLAIQLLY